MNTTTTTPRTLNGFPLREDGLLSPTDARRALCGPNMPASEVDAIFMSNLYADLDGQMNPDDANGWYLHGFQLHAALSLPAFRGNPKNLDLLLQHPNLSSDSITAIVDAVYTAVKTGTIPTGWGGIAPTVRTPYSPRCLGDALINHPNTYAEDVYNLIAVIPTFTMSAWTAGFGHDAPSGYRLLNAAIAYTQTLVGQPMTNIQMWGSFAHSFAAMAGLSGENSRTFIPGAAPTSMVAACGRMPRPDDKAPIQRHILAYHHPRKVARLAILLADCHGVFLKDHLFAPVVDPNGLIWPNLTDDLRTEVTDAMRRNGIHPVDRYFP